MNLEVLDKLVEISSNDCRFDGWKQDNQVEMFFREMGKEVPDDANDLNYVLGDLSEEEAKKLNQISEDHFDWTSYIATNLI